MYGLILRVFSVTLMLICVTALDHALHPAHHEHTASAAASCTQTAAAGGSLDDAVDRVHPAHPCVPAVVPHPVTLGDTVLTVAATTPTASLTSAMTVVTADGVQPPGRCAESVRSATCVQRN
jgi:hypothetical protein